MQLALLNYIVGESSFWNFAAPAIALIVLIVGFLAWGTAKRPGGSRTGGAIIAVGLVAFVVGAGVDVSRNIHDANELEAAAHTRYGVTLSYADAAALFDSSNITRARMGGHSVDEYGSTDITSGGKSETVFLDRLADGSFLLATDAEELPLAS